MTETESHAVSHADAAHGMGHVMPMYVLVGVFLALLVLTLLTVVAATPRFNFGPWNLAIALGIATVKAALVALYFMHLRYDHPFNGLIFVASLVCLSAFLAITLLDVLGYQGDIIPPP